MPYSYRVFIISRCVKTSLFYTCCWTNNLKKKKVHLHSPTYFHGILHISGVGSLAFRLSDAPKSSCNNWWPKSNSMKQSPFSEKPVAAQLFKKFLAFYGTRRFLTVFITKGHLSLLWAPVIKYTPYNSISFKTHFNIILPCMPRSSMQSLSFGFPYQNPVCICLLPHVCRTPSPSHPRSIDHPNNIWWGLQIRSSQFFNFLHLPNISSL